MENNINVENINENQQNTHVKKNKEVKKPKYKKIIEKRSNNSVYLYVQIVVSCIFVLSSIILKFNATSAYDSVKMSYDEFFRTETVYESNFSYTSFINNFKENLKEKYDILVQTISYAYGKGTNDYADNVSMEKYVPDQLGIKPVEGYISSPFGVRTNPFNKKEKDFHTGIDIAAAKGSFIKASFAGEVTECGYNDTAGNYIRVKNSEEQETFYCHLQFAFVKQYQKVLQGQVIGTVGDTGMATGPHLHFEVIYNQNRVNPIYTVE